MVLYHYIKYMHKLAIIGGFLYFIRLIIHWVLQLYCFCFHNHKNFPHRLSLLGITILIMPEDGAQ